MFSVPAVGKLVVELTVNVPEFPATEIVMPVEKEYAPDLATPDVADPADMEQRALDTALDRVRADAPVPEHVAKLRAESAELDAMLDGQMET